MEFITAFLNNAANDDDIEAGTLLARIKGIPIAPPKFGVSKSDYFFNHESGLIAKGLSSVKYMSDRVANELFELSASRKYTYFTDLLLDINEKTTLDARQLDILIKIDFFSSFGNQRELLRICDMFELFKKGNVKQIKKDAVDGSPFEEIVRRYSTGLTKAGKESKSYTVTDAVSILHECEEAMLAVGMEDIGLLVRFRNYCDIMGSSGYVSGDEADRNKLYIKAVFEARRKKDDALFGYNILTRSIGSGKESRMTVFATRFKRTPLKVGDIIKCTKWERSGAYFNLLDYEPLTV